MRHPLTDAYRSSRQALLDLGDTLSEDEASVMTQACPAWSIKDVYAHLAGISSDILSGNTEGAATEAWADGHVSDRADQSLPTVLDEWRVAGSTVCDIMEKAGDAFPFQLFLDQWTHEWDIRAALGDKGRATADAAIFEHYLDALVEHTTKDVPADLPALQIEIGDMAFAIGSGPSVGTLSLDPFEYARFCMGRRSQAQIDALAWPDSLDDRSPYIDRLVLWSVNDLDVNDPTI